MIVALPKVVDNSVGTFSCGAKLSLGRVFSHRGDLVQDKVAYVQLSKLYPLGVVFGHLLLVYRHFAGSFVSYFAQTIQVDSQLVVVVFFAQHLSPNTSYSYLDWNYCFNVVGESEGCLSSWGSCRGSVGPQDVGKFL